MWAVPGFTVNYQSGAHCVIPRRGTDLPPSCLISTNPYRIFTLLSKLLTFRFFLRLWCFAWSLKDERQFTLSLQVPSCETCIILTTTTFVMHRMSKPCNVQWFYISFYASVFKRFIFPVKFSYPFKSANTS